jgi:hypothetical protein
MKKHTSIVTTVTPETSGIPRTMVYGLLRDLLGEPGFVATVIGVMRKHHRPFDISVGISGPHDFAVRCHVVRRFDIAASIAFRTQRP